jgi:hypothetical protein
MRRDERIPFFKNLFIHENLMIRLMALSLRNVVSRRDWRITFVQDKFLFVLFIQSNVDNYVSADDSSGGSELEKWGEEEGSEEDPGCGNQINHMLIIIFQLMICLMAQNLWSGERRRDQRILFLRIIFIHANQSIT